MIAAARKCGDRFDFRCSNCRTPTTEKKSKRKAAAPTEPTRKRKAVAAVTEPIAAEIPSICSEDSGADDGDDDAFNELARDLGLNINFGRAASTPTVPTATGVRRRRTIKGKAATATKRRQVTAAPTVSLTTSTSTAADFDHAAPSTSTAADFGYAAPTALELVMQSQRRLEMMMSQLVSNGVNPDALNELQLRQQTMEGLLQQLLGSDNVAASRNELVSPPRHHAAVANTTPLSTR